jgi:hypothetical protein
MIDIHSWREDIILWSTYLPLIFLCIDMLINKIRIPFRMIRVLILFCVLFFFSTFIYNVAFIHADNVSNNAYICKNVSYLGY